MNINDIIFQIFYGRELTIIDNKVSILNYMSSKYKEMEIPIEISTKLINLKILELSSGNFEYHEENYILSDMHFWNTLFLEDVNVNELISILREIKVNKIISNN